MAEARRTEWIEARLMPTETGYELVMARQLDLGPGDRAEAEICPDGTAVVVVHRATKAERRETIERARARGSEGADLQVEVRRRGSGGRRA